MERSAAVEIFNSALELPPPDREAFLDRTCGHDAALRAEVESLLEVHDHHPPPSRNGPAGAAPEKVGRYPILGELGRGGMGRVYLALDAVLGRRVALKMLPAGYLHHPDQFARFRREAQILASLNHPNVAVLYSLELEGNSPFLTMELMTGHTLERRIADSPSGLGFAQSIRIAVQIARALEFAHDRGIIHRDLKPANVALTPEGGLKVLDFGLAKVIGTGTDEEAEERNLSAGPEEPASLHSGDDTIPGSVLGSPGYMSPEQIRGLSAGPASDVWALACILFECLSGRKAFAGSTPAERIESTLGREPDWKALPEKTPSRLKTLLRECLVKDAERRLASATRVRSELEAIAAAAGLRAGDLGDPARRTFSSRVLGRTRGEQLTRLLAAAVLAAAVIGILLTGRRQISTEGRPPSAHRITYSGQAGGFDLSPDDRRVAYVNMRGGLVLLDLESGTERVLYKSRAASNPLWSPDGKEILFTDADSTGHLYSYVVDQGTGRVRRIGPDPFVNASWAPGGNRILGQTYRYSDLAWRYVWVDRLSGDTTTVPGDTTINRVFAMSCAPAGESILIGGTTAAGEAGYWIAPRPGGPLTRVLRDVPILAQWSADGRHLLYLEQGEGSSTLRRVTAGAGLPAGAPETIREMGRADLFCTFHHGGRLVFRTGESVSTLSLLERRGKDGWNSRSLLTGTFNLSHPRFSPDGTKIAVAKRQAGRGNLLVVSLEDGTTRQLVAKDNLSWPAWSPSGDQIAFQGSGTGGSRVYVVDAAGGEPRAVSRQPSAGSVYWFPDRCLRYQPVSAVHRNYACMDPNTGEEHPLLRDVSHGSAFQTSISPDGRWVALAGNRNGYRGVDVWLIDLASSAERMLYHHNAAPIGWSKDGSCVYLDYARDEAGSFGQERTHVVRVPVGGGPAEEVCSLAGGQMTYWSDLDITPDGTRIAVVLAERAMDLWVADEAGSGNEARFGGE